MVKLTLSALLAAAAVTAAAQELPAFGLAGSVTIAKASGLMDGGSVAVHLRDERGSELRVFYRNDGMHGRDELSGQFSIEADTGKRRSLMREGWEERCLLHLLRVAAVQTFGTADPERLGWQARPGDRDFNRMAMASLFRQADRRVSKKPAAKRG